VGGDKNDWDLAVRIEQSPLQLDAAHPWQTHIEDQAHRVFPIGGIEVFFRRGERNCRKASGLHDAPQRLTKGFIVINDGDDARLG